MNLVLVVRGVIAMVVGFVLAALLGLISTDIEFRLGVAIILAMFWDRLTYGTWIWHDDDLHDPLDVPDDLGDIDVG